jgi:phosphatidylinositol alpha 1,6-mannosyltransferase
VTGSRPLRIALFSGNYNYVREGANQALNILVAYLERAGHQVRIYSPVTVTPAFAPQGTLVPIPSVALPLRSEFRLALRLPRSIALDVKRFAPDLIHVSTPDILGSRAETLAQRLQVPIVASFHTRFETYLRYYGLGWLRPAAEAHLRRFYRRADCVLAPTPSIADELKRLRGDERVALWSRGVDRELFAPSRRDLQWRRGLGFSDSEIVVLFLGRLVVEKGADAFVEVIRRLRAGSRNVRPLIVGAGPAEDRFRSLEGAILTGHLDGTDLARAVASADLMINPSTTEAFGNVVLEGMASGLPVISADAPSARSLIDSGTTGILRRSDDPAGLVDAAARLIDLPDERKRIGAAARAASDAYSWEAASSAAEQAYLRTVAEHARQRPPQPRFTSSLP